MSAPEISVVVEWENVLLAGAERSVTMLRRLEAQARALPRHVEIVVVCDPAGVATAPLALLLEEILGRAGEGGLEWQLVAGDDAHYYELKNLGVDSARGEIIAFLDSDVIPDGGWLAALVAALENPDVHVVAGRTHVDARGLYGGAMALGWFFPRRDTGAPHLERATHFFANNVAFRAALLRAHPFPASSDGSTRGACADLATLLRREGFQIWSTNAAQVGHPPPRGASHFFTRAIAEGRDLVLEWRRAGKRRHTLPLRIVRRHLKRSLRAVGAIALHHRSVGLSLFHVPFAWSIMAAYYALSFAGALATFAAPVRMARGFRI